MTAVDSRCTRCILPEQYPGITFDSEGVCSCCRAFDRRWAGWEPGSRESELRALLDRAARGARPYTALVGISGGKDSCYTLHKMVRDYGARVLAYTYDNGFFSEGARDNIQRMVAALGVEHRWVSMGDDLNRKVYRSLLRNRCADFCMPCANGALAAALRLAEAERAPLIVWGLSPRTEPILPLEMINAYDFRYFRNAVSGDGLTAADLAPYSYLSLPKAAGLTFLRRVRFLFLPEYVEWDETRLAHLLREEYGWVDYGGGKPHFDCVASPAASYFQNRHLGVSKDLEKLSVLVRCGQLTRDEALRRFDEDNVAEEPVESVAEVCRRLGVLRADLRPLLDGTARDYRAFPSHAALFRRARGLFWLAARLGFTTESLYQKYR